MKLLVLMREGRNSFRSWLWCWECWSL